MKKVKNVFHQELKRALNETKKSSIVVYFTLRILVIVCMVLQILRGDLNNAFLCLLTLALFIVPFFVQKKLKIELPNTLEIIILLFIFSAEILGEINNFYNVIPFWDTLLHTLNGFIAAGVGFALFDLLNKNSKNVNLSPLYLSIVAFCFSMTIGVLWEFFEFTADHYFKADMQKDRIITEVYSVLLNEKNENVAVKLENIDYSIIHGTNKDGGSYEVIIAGGFLDIGIIDTIKDLFVNFVGAACFSVFGYLYIENRDKYKFVNHFMPTRQIDE